MGTFIIVIGPTLAVASSPKFVPVNELFTAIPSLLNSVTDHPSALA